MAPGHVLPARLVGICFLVALITLAAGCRKRTSTAPVKGGKASQVKIVYPAAPGSFVRLVAKLRPVVVHLSTTVTVRGGPADWFPSSARQDETATGKLGARMRRALGTGFIIHGDGYILTNAHVVERAHSLRARLHDGTVLVAKLRGMDRACDLALLKVAPPTGTRLRAARMGDSDSLRVGEWVVALGNPFGLGVTINAGVVSARERKELAPGRHGLWGFIQTDVAIDPGNSGGPLVNVQGEVVGIATAMDTQAGSIGFALPLKVALGLMPQLKKGKVSRTWLGIWADRVTAALAKKAGLKKARGAYVKSVIHQGPADRAGLRAGDVLLSFDGQQIVSAADLPRLASLAGVDRQVEIVVWRAGKALKFTLKTEKMPE